MATVLHLVKGGDTVLAVATVERQLLAGDRVRVALLGQAPAPALPAGVEVHRVPGDWSWDRLLEEIFAADQVVAW